MKQADAIVLLLSAAAGAIDALSFLGFNVFTSAMSGNTVLLGIAIGQRRLYPAVNAAIALVFYVLGVLVAAPIRHRAGQRQSLRWVLAIELAALSGFAALVFTHDTPNPPEVAENAMIALAAFGMGCQAIAARCVNAPGINTVVFTSTLTSIAEALARALLGKSKGSPADAWRQVVAYMFYAGGAILGAFLAPHGATGTLVPTCAVFAALVLAFVLSVGPGRG